LTVGAVVAAAGAEEALADAAGRVAVRRIVDSAWAGGAMPIIVVVDDVEGRVAAALHGSPAHLVAGASLAAAAQAPVGRDASAETGPAHARGATSATEVTSAERPSMARGAGASPVLSVATWRNGAVAALEAVVGTSALLLWPGNMTWIDPETVTSLIEAHGRLPSDVLRPQRAGQDGWPVLVPAGSVLGLLASPGQEGLEERLATIQLGRVELGDPGSVLGLDVDLAALPDYAGPPEPVGGPPPEWGAAAAETPDPEVPPAS
jgi:CTP:molybdopterin cytidylyltransferase MocA